MSKLQKLTYPDDFLDKFICGNIIDVMKFIPNGSVDLVVTSPPYNLKNSTGNGMKYGRGGKWSGAALINGYSHYDDNIPHDEYVSWQRDCLTEMLRIIPDNGAIFYNHKWRVQAGLLQDRNDIVSDFPVRQIIIWQRKGGFNFNPGYFLPTYEVIYLIAKQQFKLAKKANAHGDIWEFGQESNNQHPAPFPVALIERIISSTNAKNILDPFMGSGTTALAAKNLNRQFIGIDISPEYCEMAQKRLDDPTSTIRKPKTPKKRNRANNVVSLHGTTMKTYTKESLIEALKEIRNKGWILTGRKNNDGGVGNTLEDLLGIEENNLPLPNATEWELKAQKKNTTSLVTLFHMEPSPRAFKFIPSVFLPEFGWEHQEAGKKYPATEKSFRQTISASGYSNRGFMVKVSRKEQKVLVDFSPAKIDKNAHPEWSQSVYRKFLEPVPYWGFDDLFHKVGTKLHNCFFVRVESKRIDRKLHFQYQDIFMLKALDKNKFIDAIESGNIYIDFDARSGHNHGTKFRLRNNTLLDLYKEVLSY